MDKRNPNQTRQENGEMLVSQGNKILQKLQASSSVQENNVPKAMDMLFL